MGGGGGGGVLIGVVAKQFSLKKTVIDTYASLDAFELPRLLEGKYYQTSDVVTLCDPQSIIVLHSHEEGEAQEVKMETEEGEEGVDLHEMPCGVVVALRGRVTSDSAFLVQDTLYPRPLPTPSATPAPPSLSLPVEDGTAPSPLLLCLNHISLASALPPPLTMLSNIVTGVAPCPEALRPLLSRVQATVLMGGMLAPPEESETGRQALSEADVSRAVTFAGLVAPVEALDSLLANLTGNLPVLALPSTEDPVPRGLPQPAINRVLLPSASRFGNMHLGTNPCTAEVACAPLSLSSRVTFIGEEVVADIAGQTPLTPMQALCRLASFCHLAPTAPDTLDMFPAPADNLCLCKGADDEPVLPSLLVAPSGDPKVTVGERQTVMVGDHEMTCVIVPSYKGTGCVSLLDPFSGQVHTLKIGM
ncbi:DNA polymerase delta/II small subunit family [Kipferlia bialata]|uniref:DNA polymerase delta/II small subunit family n=1 Tax=Kipferlia bialata TaxID=797122 RepID=A0A9K3CT75_9EUKA|nr:DNA polymerase delta/II small subunit family [Kipferlia bialata]GIQ84552.1 DNA polymerase delta/II small subunit family [Kipferlia bialata]|eukprot:g4088.t1